MANNIERLGVSFCEYVANKNDWIFREQPIGDIGIDAHMEFNDTDGETQRLLAIQIKSGESFFREKKTETLFLEGSMIGNITIGQHIHYRALLFFIIQMIIHVFGKN